MTRLIDDLWNQFSDTSDGWGSSINYLDFETLIKSLVEYRVVKRWDGNPSYPTDFSFDNYKDAEAKANELWLANTTEEDRKSGWCALHYYVTIQLTEEFSLKYRKG